MKERVAGRQWSLFEVDTDPMDGRPKNVLSMPRFFDNSVYRVIQFYDAYAVPNLRDGSLQGLQVGVVRLEALLACLQQTASLPPEIQRFAAEHHLDEAERICTRFGLMHRGRIVAEGTLAELRDRTGCNSLVEMFLKLSIRGPVLAGAGETES